MRRLSLSLHAGLIVGGLCGLSACHKPPAAPAAAAERLFPAVAAGDPRVANQLVAGFYGIEAGAWRWTGQQFAILLGVPQDAMRRGGNLSLRVTVPPVIIEKLGSTTLSASVGGTAMPSQTYTKPGEYTYQCEIAPALLTGGTVKADFRLERVMPPAGADARELGIIVQRASLESK